MPQETRPITAIQVGTRYRLHLGDIAALAESMQALGVLHPIVVTPDNRLIAGARRLAAAKRLGWEEIAVHVVDVPSLLETEYDENVLRKDFTIIERAQIGLALEQEIAARNAAKQIEAGKAGGKAGGRGHAKEPLVDIVPQGFEKRDERLRTTSQVGRAIGMSGKSYAKARAILQAAEKDPERYGDLVLYMEAKNSINKPYQHLRTRAALETIPGNPPATEVFNETVKNWLEMCLRVKWMNAELARSAPDAHVLFVQFSDDQLDAVEAVFHQAHALTGAWLDEVHTIRRQRP